MTPADPASPAHPEMDWDRLSSLLQRLVRGMMRHSERAQRESMDVAQSLARTLLDGGSGVLEMDPEDQRRYLATAVRHKLAGYARADKALKRGEGRTNVLTEVDPPAVDLNPAEFVITNEERAAMREALDLLEPESRAVLSLYLNGVDHPAIAAFMGTSHGAARVRFVRAKRDLEILVHSRNGESVESIAARLDLDSELVGKRLLRLEEWRARAQGW